MSAEQHEPFLVKPGFVESDVIRHAGGPGFRILYYPEGPPRFEHRCQRWPDKSVIVAPLLAAHTITYNDDKTHDWRNGAPTVTPSIDCPDCDLHGFIVDGWWRG